jgi:nucleotide-binding universal stress UspA family protein
MYKRILYATDGSRRAQRADTRPDPRRSIGAELILVHVFRHIEEFGKSPYFSEIE